MGSHHGQPAGHGGVVGWVCVSDETCKHVTCRLVVALRHVEWSSPFGVYCMGWPHNDDDDGFEFSVNVLLTHR